MSAADIMHALQLRDYDQLHGFSPADRRRYATVAGAADTFYVQDSLHRCEDLVYEPLPRPPVEVGVSTHWLLVRGVKPRTPENAVPRELLAHLRQKVRQPAPFVHGGIRRAESASGHGAVALWPILLSCGTPCSRMRFDTARAHAL